WGEYPVYPAPTWALNLKRWPATGTRPSNPLIKVWWNWDNELRPERTIERTRGAAYKDFETKTARLGGAGGEVRIEQVEIEERAVEVARGEVRQGVTCLVVRASYPPDNPMWLQPDGVQAEGWEHHYYAQAGKYTGIFWGVSRDAVEGAAFR